MATLYQQRSQFEKQLLAVVGSSLRGTPWKKSGNQIFAKSGDCFVSLCLSVHRNDVRTSAHLNFKPMDLDPILWGILGIGENQDQPLSFRALGAFTCAGLPVLESDLEQPGQTPGEVADAVVRLLESNLNSCEIRMGSIGFSELVAAHPNQVLRGAYAITLVTSTSARKFRNVVPAQFSIGILPCELPVNGALGSVPGCLPGVDFGLQRVRGWNSAIKALATEDADLDLGHVEPTRVLGRVVELHST